MKLDRSCVDAGSEGVKRPVGEDFLSGGVCVGSAVVVGGSEVGLGATGVAQQSDDIAAELKPAPATVIAPARVEAGRVFRRP